MHSSSGITGRLGAAAGVLLALALGGCMAARPSDPGFPPAGYPGGSWALAARIRDPDFHSPLVAAHRGTGTWSVDENTRAAARRVVEAGLPFMETDVRLSRDGELFILHDSTLDRTTRGSGELEEMAAADLERVRMNNGETLPHLRDLYEITRGSTVLILDFKREPGIEVAADWIDSRGSFDDALFLVNQWPEMKTAARLKRKYPRMMVMVEADGPREVEAVRRTFDGRLPEVIETGNPTPQLVALIHAGGAKVATDILGYEFIPLYGSLLTRTVIARGVDIVQSDRASHLWDWVRGRTGVPGDPTPAP